MSELLAPQLLDCPHHQNCPEQQSLPLRATTLGGGLTIARALPHRDRRLIGPWCFLDHMGPALSTGPRTINVGPHPHIGLQTVTWLFEGAIRHRDSLGNDLEIRPGQLNLMTAGRGIVHSEQSTSPAGAILHGAQLWLALPEAERHQPPRFEHIESLPQRREGAARIHCFAGRLGELQSQARCHWPLVGAEIQASDKTTLTLPLDGGFEHGLLLIDGQCHHPGGQLDKAELLYLGPGLTELPLALAAGSRLLLIGGIPFEEDVVIWWNFVARSQAEIVQARDDWQQGRLGDLPGHDGPPLAAPPLTGRVKGGR
ncbi:pirin family protein [Gallaecimonas sp. GXIMD4217]|uniref:pirin family protein n=1 Tax=Gallaecimonas sp. GXIMD4217 TaxID=3131927 RepID=UPI00311ACC1F